MLFAIQEISLALPTRNSGSFHNRFYLMLNYSYTPRD
jgi:hypothetical protein